MNINDTGIYFLAIFFATVLGIAILVRIIMWLNNFKRELKYLNIEIRRTDGRERKYWISRKRRLWLSIIPFIRY